MNNAEENRSLRSLLEKDYEAPASVLAEAEPINWNAVAFKTMVPFKLLMAHAMHQSFEKRMYERSEEEKEREARIESSVASYLKRVAANKVQLVVGGREIEISQGELCELMRKRTEELKEHRKELFKHGASREEIAACDDLIERYQQTNRGFTVFEADDKMMSKVEGLMRDDPIFEARVEQKNEYSQESEFTVTKGTSFAFQYVEEGAIAAPPLAPVFQRASTQVDNDVPDPARPRLVDYQADNTAQSLGF